MRNKLGQFLKGNAYHVKEKIKRICKRCGKVFLVPPALGDRKYCSWHCYKPMDGVINSCKTCGKKFYVPKCRKDLAQYCSYSCSAKSRVGIKSNNWKGVKKTYQGYIVIYSPNHPFKKKDNYVKRANLIMEKKLGRYLRPEERVHHINGIKDDDRPENLKHFANESEHTKYHWVIKKSHKSSV